MMIERLVTPELVARSQILPFQLLNAFMVLEEMKSQDPGATVPKAGRRVSKTKKVAVPLDQLDRFQDVMDEVCRRGEGLSFALIVSHDFVAGKHCFVLRAGHVYQHPELSTPAAWQDHHPLRRVWIHDVPLLFRFDTSILCICVRLFLSFVYVCVRARSFV